MSNHDFLKPIRSFGYFFIIIGVAGFIMHFWALNDVRYTNGFKLFVLIVSLLHLSIGSGVIFKKIWGLYALKFYLYLLYFAIPIGTYIAVKTLRYIEKYQIEKSFKEN